MIVLVVGLLLVGGVIAYGVHVFNSGMEAVGDPPSSTSSEPEVPVYYPDDSPLFDKVRTHIEQMHAKYEQARADGSIYEYVPQTDEGDAYADAFIYILLDYKIAMQWAGSPSTDLTEIEDQLRGYRNAVDEAERRFLAGEDLGYSIRIERSDGTVFESDGVAPELVVDDPEVFAQNYVARPDADGSYAAAAEEIAAAFGMTLIYEYADVDTGCSPLDYPLEEIGAMFCSARPDLIFVNPDNAYYPESLTRESFVDMIQHEIGHRRIFDICGVTRPPIAGAVPEGVTNSYAVLYLGADEDQLGGLDDSYAITDETYAIAEAIHGGQCL